MPSAAWAVCRPPSLRTARSVLRVVGFDFLRRQLLKIGWAHTVAIFVEDPDFRGKPAISRPPGFDASHRGS